MNAAEFEEVKILFLELEPRPAGERRRVLAELAVERPALAARLERLLADSQARDFLDHPALGTGFRVPAPHEVAVRLPERIGPFAVIEVLGRGGMGIVYRARQDWPGREVALKVVQPGLASASALRRLELEAELLARLQHPGIAQVYAAGMADTGAGPQPYFAMELVRGKDLLEHAQGLDRRERIELVLRVCAAVEHAHQRGVIHRDLKPANILVDASGAPKILDFGIARSMEPELTGRGLLTGEGAFVGTLPYVSPEQVAGRREEIDTRSDLYSLGVITYELLAGRLPLDVREMALPEVARAIDEGRLLPLDACDPSLRGDLATILGKVLEREKDRRYASVSAFAEDLSRCLRHQPILARPFGLAYHVRKFARRNRVFVGGAAATLLALVLGLAGTLWGFLHMRAARAEERTQRELAGRRLGEVESARDAAMLEARRASTVRDYLVAILRRGDPLRGGGGMTLLEILETARADVGAAFSGQPEIEADLRFTLGHTFVDLGAYATAAEEFVRARELRRSSLGDDHPDTLLAGNGLGVAWIEGGRAREAIPLLQEVYEADLVVRGATDPETLVAASNLALAHYEAGDLEVAERLVRSVLQARAENLGRESPECLHSLVQLARVLDRRAFWDEADTLYREVIGVGESVLGPRDRTVLNAKNNLGCLLVSRRDFAEGEALLEDAWRERLAVLGPDHPDTLMSIHNLAWAASAQGRHVRASCFYAHTLAARERLLGTLHPRTLVSRNNLAQELGEVGEFERADELFACTLADAEIALPLDHRYRAVFFSNHARLLTRAGRPGEAETLLLEAHSRLEEALGLEHELTRGVAAGLERFYGAQGRPDLAEPWRIAADPAGEEPGASAAVARARAPMPRAPAPMPRARAPIE